MRLKVIAVSSNHNSFGLRSMILISDNGQGWQALANDLNVKAKGTVFEIPEDQSVSTFLCLQSFECTRRLDPDPPRKLTQEVWGKTRTRKKQNAT